MVVEVIGCSGAGKSSLVREIQQLAREQALRIATPPDVLLPRVPRAVVRNPTLQNLAFDLAGACRAVSGRGRYRRFLAFTRAMIRRECDGLVTALNAYRSVLRTVGIHKALSRTAYAETILVDEGTVQSAHLVLAHVKRPARPDDIHTFGDLVPKPDLIVHVVAPLETVLARTFARPDPPLWYRNREENERFVRHAHTMFDQLLRDEPFSGNTLKVNCEDNGWQQYRIHARAVLERIAQRRPGA
jgi:thymidylate kinase